MLYVLLAYITYPFVSILSRFVKGDDSIVVFQTAKIGDMICTTPVFREIKVRYPDARLGVVVEPLTRPLLCYNPYVDEIIEIGEEHRRGLTGKVRLARLLRRKGYSKAIILMPNTANILSALWAMIPVRIVIQPDRMGSTLRALIRLNTHTEPHVHGRMAMETYLSSLRFIGVREWSMKKEVYASPEGEKGAEAVLKGRCPCIGLVVGTGNPLKDWGGDRFLGLIERLLSETGVMVVLLGSERDNAQARYLLERLGSPQRVLNLCGRFDLAEAPAVIKRLSLVVGVDTGLIYMADALSIPLIDIAGPSDMDDQRPIGERSSIIQKRELSCVPCSHTFFTPYECREGHRRCVEDVTVDEVFEAIVERLKRSAQGK